MKSLAIAGMGAVSPAGWSVTDLERAVAAGSPLPNSLMDRPGWKTGLKVRRVPAPNTPVSWMKHARLRRSSPITRFATAAALEALGDRAEKVANGTLHVGIVYCVMAGCVNYSGRFYREVLVDPSTASPLVFPETVFNAPASHLAALLSTPVANYTLVGDDTAFLHGLAIAAGWLRESRMDACLVVGAEELDWLTGDASRLFDRRTATAEGAGAVLLESSEAGPQLAAITSPHPYLAAGNRSDAARAMQAELDSVAPGADRFDSGHAHGPGGGTAVRAVTGNAFNAATAWQVVLAGRAVQSGAAACARIGITGCNQAAMGAVLKTQSR